MTDYRKLTDAEALLIREALGPFKPADFDYYTNWSERLRKPISAAVEVIGQSKYEWADSESAMHILAIQSGSTYAITPELQDGVTKKMLQTIKAQWKPWSGTGFFSRHLPPSVILVSAAIIVAMFLSGAGITPLSQEAALLLYHIALVAGSASLAYLILQRFIEPLGHYKHLAQLGRALLELQTIKTQEELKAETEHLVRNVPLRTSAAAEAPSAKPSADAQPA